MLSMIPRNILADSSRRKKILRKKNQVRSKLRKSKNKLKKMKNNQRKMVKKLRKVNSNPRIFLSKMTNQQKKLMKLKLQPQDHRAVVLIKKMRMILQIVRKKSSLP